MQDFCSAWNRIRPYHSGGLCGNDDRHGWSVSFTGSSFVSDIKVVMRPVILEPVVDLKLDHISKIMHRHKSV